MLLNDSFVKIGNRVDRLTRSVGSQLEVSSVDFFQTALSLFLYRCHFLHVSDQMNQLFVLLVFVKRNYRDSILKVIQIRVSCIIHQQNVLKIPILDDPQIFYVNSFFSLPALRAEEPMTHQFSFWVKMVQDYIRVAFVTSSKDYNFAQLRQLPEELHGKGTDVDPGIDLFSCGELDLKRDVMRDAEILVAVYEGFVEVEDQGVLNCIRKDLHLEGGSMMDCFSISLRDGFLLFWRYLSVCMDWMRCSLKGNRQFFSMLSIAFQMQQQLIFSWCIFYFFYSASVRATCVTNLWMRSLSSCLLLVISDFSCGFGGRMRYLSLCVFLRILVTEAPFFLPKVLSVFFFSTIISCPYLSFDWLRCEERSFFFFFQDFRVSIFFSSSLSLSSIFLMSCLLLGSSSMFESSLESLTLEGLLRLPELCLRVLRLGLERWCFTLLLLA